MRLFPELWPFGDLPPFSFDLIMADPPWLYKLRSENGEGKSAQAHYKCMPLDEIKAMPVLDLASENCLLWLYATNPMLPQGLEVLKAWGFEFATAGSWEKTTRHGKQSFGGGYIFRSSNEPILIGTRGEPKTTKSVRSSFRGLARGHSVKPEEGYRQAEKLMPNARRLELFSRTNRKGWTVWGDEAGKFGEAA
ncbi:MULTISPECIES: MT-A70 family methyltransferase [Agrobacterium tumefaciens complex]|uniref:MT-A70 family methyltransferase n=1 Tax=Agrobacterium tumefaciens complex TaxID=1183400 RepID=UPI000EF4B7E2|nr:MULTISPECIES: MT-A70 family methyltransferase [Agrobacterium tumefaciens complex]AYM56354.1 MT-A70 family protein [Agrobacterium fabrum]NSZ10730.1 DNA methyltransferase [Agrobacterium fabrum]